MKEFISQHKYMQISYLLKLLLQFPARDASLICSLSHVTSDTSEVVILYVDFTGNLCH